jgi:citrate synthase
MPRSPATSRSNAAAEPKQALSKAAVPTPKTKAAAKKRAPADDHPDKMIDAKEATAMLGIKPQTLYAYVSRGLIRAAPKRGAKASLYHREDVETVLLKSRKGDPSGAASERVIRWGGSAVMQTAITSIEPEGPRYRGKLALDLAEARRPFEDCVELLWNGILPAQSIVWQPTPIPEAFQQLNASILKIAKQTDSMRRLLALTAEGFAACNGRNAEVTLGAPVLAARKLIQVLAPTFGLLHDRPNYVPSTRAESIAAVIARSLGVANGEQELDALNACLVLSADHELSPATFAARIAASAGADVFSCVNSALGAFDGLLTGFGCDESERTLRSASSPKAYLGMLEKYTRRKEPIPGYAHPLYPSGDPRARYLIGLAKDINPRTARTRLTLNCVDAASKELGAAPNLAVGLAVVAICLGLPERSSGALMALGRISGWIAHTFEQRLAGFVVRPRARYIGPVR